MASRRPKVTVKLNSAGVRQLLHDPGVVGDLVRRGRSIQADYSQASVLTTRVLPSGRAIITVTDPQPDSLYRESWTGELQAALAAAGASRERVGSKWGPKRQWGPGLRFPRRGTGEQT